MSELERTELIGILLTMNLPSGRKDPTAENAYWLLRNMGIYNSSHPRFNRAQELLKMVVKEGEYHERSSYSNRYARIF